MNSLKTDHALLQEEVYFILMMELAFGFIVLTWLMKYYFRKKLETVREGERAKFFRLNWAFMTAETLRDMQMGNVLIYQLTFGNVPILGRILVNNLPNHACELILLISCLFLIPLIRVCLHLQANSGPDSRARAGTDEIVAEAVSD